VSTVDQDPHAAELELASAAAARGVRVVLDIRETGSGAMNDRAGLRRVMDAARRGAIDIVLVWKLDRFGRSALDLLANRRELDVCGVRFVAVTQGLDLQPGGDAISRLLLGVLALPSGMCSRTSSWSPCDQRSGLGGSVINSFGRPARAASTPTQGSPVLRSAVR